jgi:octaprenyl-diphosphate synthase
MSSPADVTTRRCILQEFARPVAAQLQEVEQQLEALVSQETGSLAPAVYQHILHAGGKRLRPLLTLLSCAAAGGDPDNAVSLATGVEVIHLSSLIHDDVIDEAEERRGQPSARTRWGNRTSILVGDLLIAETFRRLADDFGRAGLAVLAEAVVQMCHAELREDDVFHRADEAAYLQNIHGKTAELLAAACGVGALAANNADTDAPLREYGLNLGLAFQIADDLLDLYGDPAELGKPVWQDLRRGKWTLPVIVALQAAGETGRDELEGMLNAVAAGQDDLAPAVVQRVDDLGGRAEAQRRAEALGAVAREALAGLAAGPARDSLSGLADYAVRRHS